MRTYLSNFNNSYLHSYLIYMTRNKRSLILIKRLKNNSPIIPNIPNIYSKVTLVFTRKIMKPKNLNYTNIINYICLFKRINSR